MQHIFTPAKSHHESNKENACSHSKQHHGIDGKLFMSPACLPSPSSVTVVDLLRYLKKQEKVIQKLESEVSDLRRKSLDDSDIRSNTDQCINENNKRRSSMQNVPPPPPPPNQPLDNGHKRRRSSSSSSSTVSGIVLSKNSREMLKEELKRKFQRQPSAQSVQYVDAIWQEASKLDDSNNWNDSALLLGAAREVVRLESQADAEGIDDLESGDLGKRLRLCRAICNFATMLEEGCASCDRVLGGNQDTFKKIEDILIAKEKIDRSIMVATDPDENEVAAAKKLLSASLDDLLEKGRKSSLRLQAQCVALTLGYSEKVLGSNVHPVGLESLKNLVHQVCDAIPNEESLQALAAKIRKRQRCRHSNRGDHSE